MNRVHGQGGVLWVMLLLMMPMAFARAAAAGDDGATIYNAKCKACHGATGAGDTPMGKKLNVRDLGSPEAQKLTNEQMLNLISKGKNKMPAFEKQLSAEKIRLVIVHVRSLARN